MSIRGQVKWFDPKKGYGFIFGPEGQDVFVHFSQIKGDGFRSLKDGTEVDYDLVEGDKGFQAREVCPTAESASVLPPNSPSDSAPIVVSAPAPAPVAVH